MTVSAIARPMPEQKPYQPQGNIRAMWYDFSPELIIAGPADTGKSRGILERMYFLAAHHPKTRMLMTRKTRASLTESAMVTFERYVVPENSPILQGPDRANRHAYKFPNGSEIVTGGLGDDREKTRIMSTEYDLIYVQEARELAESEWEELSTRCSGRAGNMGWHQLIGDTNPDSSTHWIKQRQSAGLLKLIEARHTDNPSITQERLDVLARLTGVRRDRLYLGLWRTAEGGIYEGYDPVRHVGNVELRRDWDRYLSVDFGFTHPFVCQWWAADHDERLYRYREIYRTRRLVEDLAHDIRRYSAGETIVRVICDHDAEDRATLARHLACECVDEDPIECGTTAATKAVSPGIQAVAQRLELAGDGRPRIRFLSNARVDRDEHLADKRLPTCTEEEFEGYVWDKAQAKLNPDGSQLADAPLKVNDHGMDAMRYMVAYFDLRNPAWRFFNQSIDIQVGSEREKMRDPMTTFRTRTPEERARQKQQALDALLKGDLD